jgi:hypothetical protein
MPNKVYYLGSTKPGIHFIHGLTEQLFYNYPNLWHHVVCHTGIISLNSINELIFVMVMVCVLFEVQTEL